MAATLQIIALVATLLLALLLGMIFDAGYFQATIIAEEKLGDVPLPLLTTVLSDNHRALGYVMFLPWLALVGAPLVSRSTDYFDSSFFLLRFAAFVAIESLLSLFFVLFLLLPFIPYYMLSDMRPHTIVETLFAVTFWLCLAAIVILVVRRGRERRTRNETEQGDAGKPDPAAS